MTERLFGNVVVLAEADTTVANCNPECYGDCQDNCDCYCESYCTDDDDWDQHLCYPDCIQLTLWG